MRHGWLDVVVVLAMAPVLASALFVRLAYVSYNTPACLDGRCPAKGMISELQFHHHSVVRVNSSTR